MSSIARMSPFNHCDRHLLEPEEWERIRLSLKLSAREIQITQHIFDDDKTECIAMGLGISVHTVNTHLQRLYYKLDVRSRSQLVLRVFKNHLEHLGETGKLEPEPVYDEQDHAADVASITDTRICDLRIK
jgi:DNA-binding CsgD family transcriptional regulator